MNNKVQVNTNSEHRLIGLGNIKHPAIEHTYQVDESNLPEDIHEQLCDYLYVKGEFLKQNLVSFPLNKAWAEESLDKITSILINHLIDCNIPLPDTSLRLYHVSNEDYRNLLIDRKNLTNYLLDISSSSTIDRPNLSKSYSNLSMIYR